MESFFTLQEGIQNIIIERDNIMVIKAVQGLQEMPLQIEKKTYIEDT